MRANQLNAKTWILLFILLLSTNCFAQDENFFEIRAKKFSYSPNMLKVNIGDFVRIRLISEDVTHGLFIDGYGQNTSAHPGQDGSLTFMADKRGRYSFRCSVTCGEFHPYMIGYLVVEPNSRLLTYILLIVCTGLASLLFINLRKKSNGRR